MIESLDRRRGFIGWGISAVLHVGLLIFGAAWLIQPARVHVELGKTSTEIDFAVAPAPASTPPPQVPPPPAQPESIRPEVSGQPPKPVAKPKAAVVKEVSSASKGAIHAQPDDLHNKPPVYPEESRIAHEQGTVILRVEVTADGEPADVSILQSSGYFRLDQAARHAVQHWKFNPALTAGIPVPSEADVPVRFELH